MLTMRGMRVTFHWVSAEWELPFPGCPRNESYLSLSVRGMRVTFHWVSAEWELPFPGCPRNESYLSLSVRGMRVTFHWVSAEWELPFTECPRNESYLSLSVRGMRRTRNIQQAITLNLHKKIQQYYAIKLLNVDPTFQVAWYSAWFR